MSLDYITVKDLDRDRQTTLAPFSESGTLVVMGVIPHNTRISFDQENAQKLIDFLQKNIINP